MAPSASVAPSGSVAPAGNGIEALAAEEIARRAQAAFKSAKTYRFAGCHTNVLPAVCAKIDVTGTDFVGVMTIKNGTAQVRYVGGRNQVQADLPFWSAVIGDTTASDKSGAKLAAAINDSGRWLELPAKFTTLGADFGPAALLAELASSKGFQKGAPNKEYGRPGFIVRSDRLANSIVVATTGKPYPISVHLKNTSGVLSDFGVVFAPVTAAPAEDVVQLGALFPKNGTAGA